MNQISPADIELRHLRYFVAVAEELHFGRAARRLHLAQPPLSQQIRKLEEMLGHALFTRTSRAVKLTAVGEVFLERARITLRKVHDDVEVARSVGRGEVGFLNVGFIGSGMLTFLPAMLGQYRRHYPKVNLQLREFHTSGVIRALLEGTLDVGFLRDGGPVEGLEVAPVFSEPFVAAVPKRHRLADRKTISAAELRDEPFVLFSRSASDRAYEKTLSLCEEHGFRPQIVQEGPQWLTLLRLVGAGLGVTIAPACIERIAAPDVVCRRIRGTRTRSDIELAFRSAEDREIVRTFCSAARAAAERVHPRA
jgi:DNA-binding transcriptional LysR family regulator